MTTHTGRLSPDNTVVYFDGLAWHLPPTGNDDLTGRLHDSAEKLPQRLRQYTRRAAALIATPRMLRRPELFDRAAASHRDKGATTGDAATQERKGQPYRYRRST